MPHSASFSIVEPDIHTTWTRAQVSSTNDAMAPQNLNVPKCQIGYGRLCMSRYSGLYSGIIGLTVQKDPELLFPYAAIPVARSPLDESWPLICTYLRAPAWSILKSRTQATEWKQNTGKCCNNLVALILRRRPSHKNLQSLSSMYIL